MILIILVIVLVIAIVYVAGIVAFAKAFAEMSTQMTNGEYIRQSDAALSTVLLNCGKSQAYNCSCLTGINEWLREEHKDGTD